MAPLECPFCGRVAPSRRRFNFHAVKRHRARLKRCPLCRVAFLDASSRTIHRECHATGRVNVYKCSLCPRAFFGRPNLTVHERGHGIDRPDDGIVDPPRPSAVSAVSAAGHSVLLPPHENEYVGFENPFTCDVCSKSFKRIGNLEKHKLTHNGRSVCQGCGSSFAAPDLLQEHILSCKPERPALEMIQCDSCPRMLFGAAAHKRHAEAHRRREALSKYVCRFCDKKFRLPVGLLNHFSKAHPDGEPYGCTPCRLTFKRRQDFSSHINDHKSSGHNGMISINSEHFIQYEDKTESNGSNETTVCGVLDDIIDDDNFDILNFVNCSSTDNQINTTRNELKVKEIIKRNKTVKCYICGLALNKNSLRNHLYRHHYFSKMFSCYICASRFRSNVKLNFHIQQHFKNDKESLCICGVKCSSASEMEEHSKSCQSRATIQTSTESMFQELIDGLDDDSVIIVDVSNESTEMESEEHEKPATSPLITGNVTIKKISPEEANRRRKINIKSFKISDTSTPSPTVDKKTIPPTTQLISVNPLAHLVPDRDIPQHSNGKKNNFDYEKIIKSQLMGLESYNSYLFSKDRRKPHRTKTYDYAAIIEKTLGEPVKPWNPFGQNDVEDSNESTARTAKFDYAMLVKDSIGDGITYE